uniref:Uncharacterized protein n=1 Tax=Parascaris equorum TaxID=6256 RepID=A0A914RXT9_PAREQ
MNALVICSVESVYLSFAVPPACYEHGMSDVYTATVATWQITQ